MVKDISLKMVLFSLLIGSILLLPVQGVDNSLPPYCDQCAGMLDNQKLNEACNYWASYGRCPIGYTAESKGLFKNECPCKKTDLSTYIGINAGIVHPTSTPVYSATMTKPSSTSSKTTPVDINIQASDAGVTHWVKDATSLEGSFVNVRVTGVPNSDYYIWVKDTASMSGLAGDQPPSIALNDYTVKRDSASGPYEIGKFLFNGGNGKTVKQNVADDPENHGTRYYALVRMNVEGSMNVLWNIPQKSAGKSFTIHVERKIGDEFESSEAIIRVKPVDIIVTSTQPSATPTIIIPNTVPPTILPSSVTLVPPSTMSQSQFSEEGESRSVQEWLKKGMNLDKQGKLEEAVEAYNKAIEIDPTNGDSWLLKGFSLYGLSRYEDSIDALEKGLESNPKDGEGWGLKALAHFNLGQYDESIKSYDKAIEFDPTNKLNWSGKGLTLSKMGKYEEAIQSFDEAIKLDPNFTDAKTLRALALSEGK